MDRDLVSSFSLIGRTAVIIGAGSGIGRQAALTFAKAGASLVLGDAHSEGLAETARLTGLEASRVVTRNVDVRDREALQEFADLASSQGGADVWANVAGVISSGTVAQMEAAELDRIVDINLKGTYWGCAAAARIMAPRGRGSIINISSAGADSPAVGLSVYAMTKAAVNMLTRTLAHEVGPAGVRVNAVAPGFIDTPMVSYRFTTVTGDMDIQKRDALYALRAEQAALRRIGDPIDVALTMLFLASDASAFMTGQVLRPNGGYVMP